MSNILNTAEIVSTLTSLNPKLTHISDNTTNYVTKLQTIVDSHNTGETESEKLGGLAKMLGYEIKTYNTAKEGIEQFIAANNKFIAECQKIESGEAVIDEDNMQDTITGFSNSLAGVMALLATSTFAGDEQLQYRADDLKFGQSQMVKKLQQFQELKINTNSIYDNAIATIEDALGAQQQLNNCSFDKGKGKYSIPKDTRDWMNYLDMDADGKGLVRKGYITKEGNVTDKGFDYLGDCFDDENELSKEEAAYAINILKYVDTANEFEKLLKKGYCNVEKTDVSVNGYIQKDAATNYVASENFKLLMETWNATALIDNRYNSENFSDAAWKSNRNEVLYSVAALNFLDSCPSIGSNSMSILTDVKVKTVDGVSKIEFVGLNDKKTRDLGNSKAAIKGAEEQDIRRYNEAKSKETVEFMLAVAGLCLKMPVKYDVWGNLQVGNNIVGYSKNIEDILNKNDLVMNNSATTNSISVKNPMPDNGDTGCDDVNDLALNFNIGYIQNNGNDIVKIKGPKFQSQLDYYNEYVVKEFNSLNVKDRETGKVLKISKMDEGDFYDSTSSKAVNNMRKLGYYDGESDIIDEFEKNGKGSLK